jgi:hypothetical protein
MSVKSLKAVSLSSKDDCKPLFHLSQHLKKYVLLLLDLDFLNSIKPQTRVQPYVLRQCTMYRAPSDGVVMDCSASQQSLSLSPRPRAVRKDMSTPPTSSSLFICCQSQFSILFTYREFIFASWKCLLTCYSCWFEYCNCSQCEV